MENTTSEYNNEPVFYCKNCGSLLIKSTADGAYDYCGDCDSMDIGSTTIDEYLKMKF